MKNNPKFSILIPTRNGGKYLPYCLESLISQDYDDVEIIVSNNCSEDNTSSYLSSVTDKRVRVIKPAEVLSMAYHYEFALSQAKGDWIMILGDDDGVQPYFFELAEFLTTQAEKKNLNLINSARSYFFWAGCESFYADNLVGYHADAFCAVENIKIQGLSVLIGQKAYFETPQMYTTSLFNRKIIEKVKQKQEGAFYKAITPDANGAAIAFSVENNYLDCKVPLAWVGTSPKSYAVLGEIGYGRIENENQEETQARIAESFNLSFNKSHSWHELAGNMKICSAVLYYWEALLQSESIQAERVRKIVNSKIVKTLAFAGILRELKDDTKTKEQRLTWLKEICDINKCSFMQVKLAANLIVPILLIILKKMEKVKNSKFKKSPEMEYILKQTEVNKNTTIIDACNMINELNKKEKFIETFINRL